MAEVGDDSWIDAEREAAGACPVCASRDVLPIVYGHPMPGEYKRLADRVDFAGCVVPPDPPRFRCGRCGATWGGLRFD